MTTPTLPTVIEHPIGVLSPSLLDTITLTGFDFTTVTASVLNMRPYSSSTLTINAASETISNAAVGSMNTTYNWVTNDVATGGLYVAWHTLTLPGAVTQDTPQFYVYLYDLLGTKVNGNLCTVADVRLASRIAETVRDAEIQVWIASASTMIMRYCDREFAPASTGLTRTFPIDVSGGDLVIELNPYDLRTATTVTLSPEGAATVLTSTQYSLEPVNAADGVYKRIKLSPFVGGIISVWALNFGYAKLSITGNWGWPAVPPDVNAACVRTVQSWIDVAYGAYASRDVFSDEIRQTFATPESTYGLPLSAQRMLYTYRRMVI